MDKPSAKYEVIHEIISMEGNLQNIKELCAIAGVSRSGYYNWVASADKRAEKEAADRADFELILQAYQFRGYDKGIRGIHMRLLHMDPPVLMNLKKIQRLMHKYGLKCPIRKANLTVVWLRLLKQMLWLTTSSKGSLRNMVLARYY